MESAARTLQTAAAVSSVRSEVGIMQGLHVMLILVIVGLTDITHGSSVRQRRELSAECEEDLKKFESCYLK